MRSEEKPGVRGTQDGPPPCPPYPVQVLTMYHCLENQGSEGTTRERFTRRLKVCCSNQHTCRVHRDSTNYSLQGCGEQRREG